ncbi:MAG: transposase, partial [Chthoniobacterales bacterium]
MDLVWVKGPPLPARGIIGSRRLERACRENVVFMAMACGSAPDHSTIAAFVGKLE